MRALEQHETGMNLFLRWAARLDVRKGYLWYVALLDVLGGYYMKLTGRL